MKVIEIIDRALSAGRTRFALELLPPLKGERISTIFDTLDSLREFDPAYVNITYHREDVKYVEREGGLLERRIVRRRPGTIGIAAAIAARYGIEAVPHIICGGFSRTEIEDVLIEMDFMGLDNVLALRGDTLRGENAFIPHPGGYSHASELVKHISDMNRGVYVDSEIENCHSTNFSTGVAGYPEKHAESPNLESDMAFLREKVDAGADYIVTQMFFDNAKYFSFVSRCRDAGITVPVVPGLKPFSSRRQLTLLPQTFGVELPEPLVKAVNSCKSDESIRQTGIEWAISQSKELISAGVPVLHFYTMGKSDNIVKIGREIF